MEVTPVGKTSQPIHVERWPSEMPLFAIIVVLSVLLWAGIILGTMGIGLIYAVLIGLFLFFAHAALIAHIRGSAIKLGPEQFPELYARVVEFASRAGLKSAPSAYLLQADGGLNAFATKFFRGRFVVLYSDLLSACGDDETARDMIIGHEIGHLRANHLNWNLLTLPGRVIPFLGSAYSRACEFTCDRWGSALCGDSQGARRGLLVLAAGAGHYHKVNEAAFIRQQDDLNTGWMTLSRWLGTYPPLSARVQAIGPNFGSTHSSTKGALRAWGIILAFVALPVAAALSIPFFLASPLAEIGRTVEGEIGSELNQTQNNDSTGVPAGVTTYASVEDMPSPAPVPTLDDPNLTTVAQACSTGDMASCDNLYSITDSDTPGEAYGNSCGGRFPDNIYPCVDLLRKP